MYFIDFMLFNFNSSKLVFFICKHVFTACCNVIMPFVRLEYNHLQLIKLKFLVRFYTDNFMFSFWNWHNIGENKAK